MFHKILTHRVGYWLARFIQFQLFITLISLPLLTTWGLPISWLTLLGNLIFSPVLTAFLFLSSLLFFFELTHLPTACIAYSLEAITKVWLWTIAQVGTWPFVYFPKPPITWCLAVPIEALIIIHHKKTRGIVPSIVALSALMIFSTAYLKIMHTPAVLHTTIPCNRGNVTIVRAGGKTALIDPGFIGQRKSALSWIEYTLPQALVTMIGSPAINHLVLLKSNTMTLKAITKLITLIPISAIHLPKISQSDDQELHQNLKDAAEKKEL